MCFSPEADLIAGFAISAVGIDALRQSSEPKDRLLSVIPIALGAHQLIETFVWWGERGEVPATVGHVAAWIYLLMAFLLPSLVPLALVMSEREPTRRRWMTGCAALGAAVSIILIGSLVRSGIEVVIRDLHIAYRMDIPNGKVVTLFYVIAVCGPLLVSSSRRVVLFGIVNVVAVSAIAWAISDGVISLWCLWAAMTSLLIDWHLRQGPEIDYRSQSSPAAATADASTWTATSEVPTRRG